MTPERLELQTQSLQIIGYGFWGTLKDMSQGGCYDYLTPFIVFLHTHSC